MTWQWHFSIRVTLGTGTKIELNSQVTSKVIY